ncbi:protein vein [Anopheles funestus]|uniref:protein vein n=1 Tax=Anopheles funestus TaxID=62324 RepID=UPI0020C72631|nr:protein vein [Anopheles funestus]XP_049292315.1 protein vein [Anopheles funestus]XP_049292316.1 protein vein [Anopheles funestus]XP_049292317.1 protein vein [Anopheles funestus]XP_049292318.1 protein vein [Anopheles funestus]XP_049292319.1 protein vein [Anopheles funestus]XP_049292320.1 protein vein [Anopheles funestus]XP_049292322.1 protein vein [Anopheles funestus]XP_049292323.1 protein vein [Anopheles funestus]XP_049292324.1 protein vein [Anopheles funestus]XP_049292325.1 protein ve
MYLRKWSPVKCLMYLWLAILVWMFSRCDSAATMHLAPAPYHSSGYQGTTGGHSSSISSSSSSSSGRYVSDSSRTTPSISSRTPADGAHQVESLAGGAIPPRLYDATRTLTHPLPLLPLPSHTTSSGSQLPWVQPGRTNSKVSAVQMPRRNSANTKLSHNEPQPGRHLPNQLYQMLAPGRTAVAANTGAAAPSIGVSSTDSSSINGSPEATVAERSLQQQWAAQMRLKGERRRIHRRRWRTVSGANPLGNRNRRDSTLPTGGYGVRSVTTGTQQHSARPQRRNGTGGNGSRRYCSARDPATLAFEAPIVCEAKVKSMSDRRPTFAATFEILTVHKQPPKGRLQRSRTVRLPFNLTTTNECDIFRGKFRERGYVREELELGKVYFLFLKANNMGYTNFTILGQPIRKIKRSEVGVLQGVNPNYGTRPVIHFITPNVTRLEGKRVRLVCKVSGQPPPKVAWFKDKRLINRNATKYSQLHLKKRSELNIFNASTTDTGEYECRAKNRYNNSSVFNSTHVKITLPKPTIPGVHMRPCAESHRLDFCHNGGACYSIDSLGELYCSCETGFSGHRCENKDSNPPASTNKQQDCTSQRYAGYYC